LLDATCCDMSAEHLPFVGRQHELAVFRENLEAASRSRGGVVFVAGEPGIGKTRLVLEVGRLARAEGWEILPGRAYDSEGMPPYSPFVEALREYVRRCPSDALRAQLGESALQVARVVAEVRRRFPDLPESPTLDPEIDRHRLFEALTDFVLAIAQAGPGPGVLLVLDDLHWADKSSLQLLHYLAHHLAESRLLVAASYRTVELNREHPLAAVLADLRRERLSERLLLEPLPTQDIAIFVEALAGVRPAADVLEAIASQTDGNPFFVRELTLHLRTEGLLRLNSQTNPTTAAWSIPEGVREVIDRRLVRLGALANQMLQAAAVLGDGFSFEVLQVMSDIEASLLLDAVDDAVAAGILREEGEGHFFGHALIRETLYSQLSLARQRHLHARAGQALEAVHAAGLAPYIGEIAEHYRLAGPLADPAKAIEFALRAGEAASNVFAFDQASTHWQTALQLMQRHAAGVDERISLLERLAALTHWMGFAHYPEAVSYWEDCLRLCVANGRAERTAHVRARLGGLLASNASTQDIPAALAHFHAAEAVLKQGSDELALAYLYLGRGLAAIWAARTPEGLADSQRGMELADRLFDQGLWTSCATHHSWHLVSSGRLSEGVALAERAWQMGDRLDRTYEAYGATSFPGNRYFLLDDPAAAGVCFERELAKPRSAAAPTRRLALVSSLAAVRARMGNLVGAKHLMAQLGPHTFNQDSAMLAEPLVAFWSGDWDSAAAAWSGARERHRRAGNRWGVADFACWLGQLLHVRGDMLGATQALEEALAIAVESPIVPIEVKARAALALLAAEQGDVSESRSHLTRCGEILDGREDWRGLAGRVGLADAVATAAEGNAEHADAGFTDAIQLCRRYALPWDEADAFRWWASALKRAGRMLDASAKLESALEIYARCGGGTVWIDRVRQAMPDADVRHAMYPDGLSGREIQVVRLIAAGKSNREIAQALVISRNTVERHVNHILAKTGATNRTQVAGYAHRHMLVG
jgi:DNA-binding CsgD family transcriptional regulator